MDAILCTWVYSSLTLGNFFLFFFFCVGGGWGTSEIQSTTVFPTYPPILSCTEQARTQLFLRGGGGLHFKLERTLGYQSLKYDI